jgi:hypothetical protein
MHGTAYVRDLSKKKGKLFIYRAGKPMREDRTDSKQKHLRRYNQMLVDDFEVQSAK